MVEDIQHEIRKYQCGFKQYHISNLYAKWDTGRKSRINKKEYKALEDFEVDNKLIGMIEITPKEKESMVKINNRM